MSTLSMKDYIIKNHELDKFKLLYLENAPQTDLLCLEICG